MPGTSLPNASVPISLLYSCYISITARKDFSEIADFDLAFQTVEKSVQQLSLQVNGSGNAGSKEKTDFKFK